MGLKEIYLDSKTVEASQSYQAVNIGADKTINSASGLSATTLYYFKVRGVEYDITTAAALTFADIILLMNAELTATPNDTFSIVDGNLRCGSLALGVAITAGSTGTDLFATLTGYVALLTAVNNVATWDFQAPGNKAQLVQIRVNFPIYYNATIVWTLLKARGSEFDQRFSQVISTASSSFYITDVNLYIQSGDVIRISTDGAVAGSTSMEVGYLGNGY